MPAEMKPFILFAKDNKSSRLQTPCEMLLPHLRFWPFSTTLMARSDAALVLRHHNRLLTTHTLQHVKAEERNLGDSCRGEEEEKITRPCLLGLACPHV